MKFIAHGLFSTDDGSGRDLVLYENMYLIYADTGEEAQIKAEKICKSIEYNSQDVELDDKKAKHLFKGIRKIMKLSIFTPDNLYDGIELTYNRYEVDNIQMIDDIIDGKTVTIRIEPD